MNPSPLIAPSVLACDLGRLREEVQAAEAAGADWIHVDVMDGHFVPNLTMGPDWVGAIRKSTKLFLDVHLMIETPELYLAAFRDAGADGLSIQVEATNHLQKCLATIRELGARPAVALNPATPLYCLDHVWSDLDMVLLMSVNPGFGGQKFIPETLRKTNHLQKKAERMAPNLRIEVDGGVGLANMKELWSAGASVFVTGTAFFRTPNYRQTLQSMREALQP